MKKKSKIIKIPKHKLTLGQRFSDKIAKIGGSWGFILGFLLFLSVWIIINIIGWTKNWDPYPFILLNLVLSMIAAIQAPVILMSQNRSAQRDRLEAKYDHQVNRKAEREIEDMQKDLDQIKIMIKNINSYITHEKLYQRIKNLIKVKQKTLKNDKFKKPKSKKAKKRQRR